MSHICVCFDSSNVPNICVLYKIQMSRICVCFGILHVPHMCVLHVCALQKFKCPAYMRPKYCCFVNVNVPHTFVPSIVVSYASSAISGNNKHVSVNNKKESTCTRERNPVYVWEGRGGAGGDACTREGMCVTKDGSRGYFNLCISRSLLYQ